MTSPRRRQGSPVKSAQLKVTLRGDKESLSKIKDAVPGATWRDGALEVRIEGRRPLELAEDAKILSEIVRAELVGGGARQAGRKTPKDYKRSGEVADQ